MDVLVFLFNLVMLFSGAYVPLDAVKYPNTLMLINRVAFIGLLIYLIIWVIKEKIMVRVLSLVTY